MLNMKYQSGIFDKQADVLILPNADIEYRTGFLGQEEAFELYDALQEQTDWQQDTIKVYGKSHLTPRLTSWVGDSWMTYRYSNNTMKPASWNPLLLSIKTKVEQATNTKFNSVLVNYYRDGGDSNGWHSDDEPELGARPIIASLSLGAARDFHLRHKIRKELKQSIALENGSLLLMRGDTQSCWQHQIPKRAQAAGRINLTFRTIIKPA